MFGAMVFALFLIIDSFAQSSSPGVVRLGSSDYHYKDLALDQCTQPIGNSTPIKSQEFDGSSFNLRVMQCYSPGGLVLSGNVTASNGSVLVFELSARQLRDSNGWVTWISGDGRVAVRWNGSYSVQMLVAIG